ncbi:IDEAL domain-containing protein [Heyndrickxia acidicola]|uniref:IDEAL domain-containing protein n=1 Tax=Heyndrickxia acidicola TaxID=209389 RepID=A0ABU6MHE0_9BACI|nr:IDEAL domain-containing protein [Heyndrickxia acidicola]MED1202470.1 IDEAL domain-containing protein [Heyndrickxia acidicola]
MEKKKSYAEIVKAYAMTRIQSERFMEELFTDMMLNELLLSTKKERLLKKIDDALDNKDKETFKLLTEELKGLTKQFG